MKSFKEHLKEYNDKSSYDMARGKGKQEWLVTFDTATHTGYEEIVVTGTKGNEKDAKRALLMSRKSNTFNVKVKKKLGIRK